MRESNQPVRFDARGLVGVRLASVLLICILVLSMIPSLLSSASVDPAGSNFLLPPADGPIPDYMKYIQVNDLRFDPLAGGPSIPAALRYSSISSSVLAYYIVQFKAPITSETKATLSEAGASILGYVNYNAFVVKAEGLSIERVNQLASVRWVGTFEPAYKLSPRLSPQFDQLLQKKAALDRPSSGVTPQLEPTFDQQIDIRVLAFEPSQLGNILSRISVLGGKDAQWSDSSSGMVRAKMDRNAIAQLALEPGVMWIDLQDNYSVYNDIARWVVQSGNATGYLTPVHDHGIYGTGQTVTVSDTGLDYDHKDFSDPSYSIPGPDHRKVSAYYTPPGATGDLSDNGPVYHGTHVSGTVAGDDGEWHAYDGNPLGSNGTAGPHDGQAFNASLQIQDISTDGFSVSPPDDLHNMYQAALDRGSYIDTNSWGSSGNQYGLSARATDDFIWNNRDFIVLFAAGNDGPDLASVSQETVAKNIISVGASGNGGSLEDVADFSSRGPTADGRIKPDVMAPGVSIWSAEGNDPAPPLNLYRQLSGTSMATPTVAGCVALIREYYMTGWYPTGTRDLGEGFVPSAALVKATLINSAHEMTGDGAYWNNEAVYPNNNQGWGRVTLDDALYFRGDSRLLFLDDNSSVLDTGSSHHYLISVADQTVPFEVTLVWSDFPGMPFTRPSLVNDLDLTVTSPSGTVYRGNAFIGSKPGQSGPNATRVDHLNNVESVLVINNAVQGIWDIRVSGFNVPEGPQPYALVATGGLVNEQGRVNLDRAHYQSSATVRITVADTGLNVDPNAVDSATVGISSTTEPIWESVTVTETSKNSSLFLGYIPLVNSAVPVGGDGKLEVQNGDIIAVRYFDANDGSGGAGYVYDTAVVDDVPPVISNLTVTRVRYSNALVQWNTDEPSDSTLRYGTSKPPGTEAINGGLTLAHILPLSKLVSNATYWFYVISADDAGNVAVADNSSNFYSFRTTSKPLMPLASDEWPTFHNNPAGSGLSPSRISPPLVNQWQIQQGSNSRYTSPVVSDGLLFTTAIDGSITARDAITGSVLWHVKPGVGYSACGTPAVADGVVYASFELAGQYDFYGKLFALDEQTGRVLWSAGNEEAFNVIISNALVVADGLVFISTSGPGDYNYTNPNAVIAFGALNGTVVWAHGTNASSSGGPVVANGRVFVPTAASNEIYSLDESTGHLLWSRSLDGTVVGSPTAADGCVFAGTLGGTMYALDQMDGSIIWQVGGWGQILHSTPAFNGTAVFFGTVNGVVAALDSANGSIVWSRSTGDTIESSLAYANGYLFYSTLLAHLMVVNASSGLTAQLLSLGAFSASSSSPAVADGWVWLESDDGRTFGFLGSVQVGVQLTPLQDSKDASPGMAVAYQVDVKNRGTLGSDVFDAEVAPGSRGWPVELFESDGSTPLGDSNSNGLPDTGALATSSSIAIVAKVSVPPSAAVNDMQSCLIRFISSNDPSISKTTSIRTSVPPPGVTLSPNSYNDSAPGRSEKAIIDLKNTGAIVDVFTLSALSSLGWSTSLTHSDGMTPFTDTDGDGVIDTGPVPGLANLTLAVSVTVPTIVGPGTLEETSVGATSALDVNSSAHILFTIEIPGNPTDDWPTSQHDNARTGAVNSSFSLPLSKIWTYPGGRFYYESTSPVVTGDTIFYGSVNGNLTAVDRSTGMQTWVSQLGLVGRSMSSPTLGEGILFIGYTSVVGLECMSAIDAETGLIVWTFHTSGPAGSGTPVLYHGILYMTDRTGVVYALDPSLGTELWEYRLGQEVVLGPSVIDGLIMVGTLQNEVLAIAADGDPAWMVSVDAAVSGPIIGGDGSVFFSDSSGAIYALHSQTGSLIWKQRLGDGSRQLQLAYSNGTLFVSGSIVAAVNGTNGVTVWSHHPTVTRWTSLVVDRGLFFTIGEDGVLYVLNSSRGSSSASFLVNPLGARNAPALMKGYLYATDNSGGLTGFAFDGAGEPFNLSLTPSSSSVVIGGSRTFFASVQDRYGNPLSNQTFNWSVESGPGTIFKVGDRGEQAMFVAGLVSETSTIMISIGTHNATASIEILPGSPHDLAIAPNEAAISVEQHLFFSATVRDLVGNVIPGSPVVWSSTIGTISPQGIFSAGTTAGTGLVRATYAGLSSDVAITVLPGELFNISISPSELELEPDSSATITAAGYDTHGNVITGLTFTWETTIGSLMPVGGTSQVILQSGFLVGTGAVIARSGGQNAVADVLVVPGPVASLVLSPPVLVLDAGSFQTLEVRAYDAFGNLVPDASFVWSDTGEGDWQLSVTSNSVASFYSGTSGGTAIITVTLGSKVATMVITINPEPVKEEPSLMTYTLEATTAVLAGMVVVLAWMLSRRKPGAKTPSLEENDGPPGP